MIKKILFFPLLWTYEEFRTSKDAHDAIFWWCIGALISASYYSIPVLLITGIILYPHVALPILGIVLGIGLFFLLIPAYLWRVIKVKEKEKELCNGGKLYMFGDELWRVAKYNLRYYEMRTVYGNKLFRRPLSLFHLFKPVEMMMQYINPFKKDIFGPEDIIGRVFNYQGEKWLAVKYEGYDMYWFQSLTNKRFIEIPYSYVDEYKEATAKNKK